MQAFGQTIQGWHNPLIRPEPLQPLVKHLHVALAQDLCASLPFWFSTSVSEPMSADIEAG
jgi:hypothetical protein